ncbi:MAG TPA: polymer-forming cytoskeletal protein [Methyloceanibacter sp.]|nr:polymer-forming cytoskeletal protein [Methyloceanibacter sp.]
MFGSKNRGTVIAKGLKIVGTVTAEGLVEVNGRVDGEVKGDVSCVALVLGESAKLEGNVIAEDVLIRGRLIGSIRALRVTLQAMCHVEGDIFHQSIALEQGAFFEGRSCRCDDPMHVGEAALANGAATKPSGIVEQAAQRKEKPTHRFNRSLPESRSA